jgi:hypothetical protein
VVEFKVSKLNIIVARHTCGVDDRQEAYERVGENRSIMVTRLCACFKVNNHTGLAKVALAVPNCPHTYGIS